MLALADGEIRLPEERGANMSGPVGSLMRAAFGKSEEIDDGTSKRRVPSSISPRPPGRLEFNAGGEGEIGP